MAVGAAATAYVGGSLRYLSDQTGAYDFDYRTANGRQREIASYEVLDLRTGVISVATRSSCMPRT